MTEAEDRPGLSYSSCTTPLFQGSLGKLKENEAGDITSFFQGCCHCHKEYFVYIQTFQKIIMVKISLAITASPKKSFGVVIDKSDFFYFILSPHRTVPRILFKDRITINWVKGYSTARPWEELTRDFGSCWSPVIHTVSRENQEQYQLFWLLN